MLKNLSAAVESLWEAYACAFSATCRTQDGRGLLASRVGESILSMDGRNLSRGSATLYLEKIRWPDGFVCGKCATVGEPFRLSSHPRKLKCRSCQHLESVTADTVMHRSKSSIHVWFWAAYLVATQTPGYSCPS